ncbi:MAG: tetratricopeptide repeat protein, partial [Planctomycetota bacterium]|nr:tetratricopeptide repeat protein [Planctomycetota bacterium]
EAVRLYQEALERDPNLGRVHYEIGNLYLKRNQFANAETRLKKALELDPGNNRALLARAILYHLTHRDPLAWQDIQELRRRGFEVSEDLRAAVLAGLQEEKNKKRFRPGD